MQNLSSFRLHNLAIIMNYFNMSRREIGSLWCSFAVLPSSSIPNGSFHERDSFGTLLENPIALSLYSFDDDFHFATKKVFYLSILCFSSPKHLLQSSINTNIATLYRLSFIWWLSLNTELGCRKGNDLVGSISRIKELN